MAEINDKAISSELAREAVSCTSVEELLALAEKNGLSITAEEAQAFLDKLSEHDLTDEDLDLVAGGLIPQWLKDAMK